MTFIKVVEFKNEILLNTIMNLYTNLVQCVCYENVIWMLVNGIK